VPRSASGAEALFRQPGENEGVNRVLDPIPVGGECEARNVRLASFDKSPVLALRGRELAERRRLFFCKQVRKKNSSNEPQIRPH
jgi:hypothetical protein